MPRDNHARRNVYCMIALSLVSYINRAISHKMCTFFLLFSYVTLMTPHYIHCNNNYLGAWCGFARMFLPPAVVEVMKMALPVCVCALVESTLSEKLKAWSTAMAQPVETTTILNAPSFWMLLGLNTLWCFKSVADLYFTGPFCFTWQSQIPISTTSRQ